MSFGTAEHLEAYLQELKHVEADVVVRQLLVKLLQTRGKLRKEANRSRCMRAIEGRTLKSVLLMYSKTSAGVLD